MHNWVELKKVATRSWTCGHCGLTVAADLGYYRNDGFNTGSGRVGPATVVPAHLANESMPRILICAKCFRPTYFEGDQQMPGAPYGPEVDHLPADVGSLYNEARNCMKVSAFTAAALATRKLLMNVAVSQGANPNETFQSYVQFLADKGFVPPSGKGWVDHIRSKGNEATHEIPAISEADAKDILTFMEMILRLVFDYPNRVPGHGSTAAGS